MKIVRTLVGITPFIALLLLSAGTAYSQSAYVNTQEGIFKLTGGPGNSSSISVDNGCGIDNNLLSIAVYKDTVYYTTWSGELKRFKAGVPGSCEILIDGGQPFNAMTIDKNGIIYMATQELSRYNPYTKELTNLGPMPFFSGGDMIFYKDKLFLAGFDPLDWSSGIFELIPDNLADSKLYMSTPPFIGLLSHPTPCGKSRYFGLSYFNGYQTQLIELDLENKVVTGDASSVPMDILDAASSTETGLDDAVIINRLEITKSIQSSTSSVRVTAAYPTPGTITYTLDNSSTNTSGIFLNVPAGRHSIMVVAAGGMCSTDTVFTFSYESQNFPSGSNDVFIPNAFTPNNDGRNDLFSISFPSAFKVITLQVFNRGGTKLYEGRGNSFAWDGSFRGAKQPTGVYVYTLSYTGQNGVRNNLKGTLTLIQ